MKATWYILRCGGKTFVALDGTKTEQPETKLRVLVVNRRIAANDWHVSLVGDLWAEFRKQKEADGWHVAPLYCGPEVI